MDADGAVRLAQDFRYRPPAKALVEASPEEPKPGPAAREVVRAPDEEGCEIEPP